MTREFTKLNIMLLVLWSSHVHFEWKKRGLSSFFWCSWVNILFLYQDILIEAGKIKNGFISLL